MSDSLIEVGRCCGMEVNVENSKDDVQNIEYDATQQSENVEFLNCLVSVITNYVRCRLEIKFVWNVALYGSECGALRKLDQKYKESFELRCWGRMEKFTWSDGGRKEGLQIVREGRNIILK